MKSVSARMRKMAEMNNHGQVGINTVTTVVVGLMVFIFVVFAVFYGISTLNPASFFSAGSLEANETSNLQKNLTTGVANFGAKIPTALTVLAVVFILGFIGLLIFTVYRFAANRSGGGLS